LADWRIFYGDGSTYNSDEGAWEDAPGWNVQIILFRDPEAGWAMRHNGDFFWLADDGAVVAMDGTGMLDHVINALGLVKAGRMLTKAQFDKIYQRAKRELAELKAR